MKKSIMGRSTPTRMTVSPAAVSVRDSWVRGWCAPGVVARAEEGSVDEGSVDEGSVDEGSVDEGTEEGMSLEWRRNLARY
jgi:hypothetical protein